jgi:hypothetical protein
LIQLKSEIENNISVTMHGTARENNSLLSMKLETQSTFLNKWLVSCDK